MKTNNYENDVVLTKFKNNQNKIHQKNTDNFYFWEILRLDNIFIFGKVLSRKSSEKVKEE